MSLNTQLHRISVFSNSIIVPKLLHLQLLYPPQYLDDYSNRVRCLFWVFLHCSAHITTPPITVTFPILGEDDYSNRVRCLFWVFLHYSAHITTLPITVTFPILGEDDYSNRVRCLFWVFLHYSAHITTPPITVTSPILTFLSGTLCTVAVFSDLYYTK